MKSNLIRHNSIIRLAAFALFGLCFVQPTAGAQAPPEPGIAETTLSDPAPSSAGEEDSIWLDLGSPLGIVPGQTLRISVLNPLAPAPPGEDGRKYKMLFAPLILDADGSVIAQSDEITLEPGEFHSFDFKRSDLPLAGEPGTGRLQVRTEIRRRFFPGIASRIPQGKFPGAVELIDNSSGKTMLLPAVQAARFAPPPANANDETLVFFLGGIPLGFVRGQTMRITVVNPDQPQSQVPNGPGRRMLVTTLSFDAQGNAVAVGDEITLDPGEFHSFDFNRDDIDLAGEPGAGRLQVRTEIRFRIFSIVDRTRISPDEIPTSLEVVDNATGKSTVMISSKPKEIVVVGSH